MCRMDVHKINVADLLKSIAGDRTIDWVLNPGNAGDSLISAGTVQLLTDRNIPFRSINDYDHYDSTGRILCYSGGGCFVPYYSFGRDFLSKHLERADRIILLPHTIDGNEDFLASLRSNVTLICRESASYMHCRRVTKVDVYAADDLAFSLDARKFLARRARWLARLMEMFGAQSADSLSHRDPRISVKMQERYRNFLTNAKVTKTLAVWREDVERNEQRPVNAENDIANIFGIESSYGLPAMLTSAEYFLRAVDLFEAIRTDRLHVAVAGAILGKDVEIFPNSYFKNRAMYEFSLRRYPNVRFVEWT